MDDYSLALSQKIAGERTSFRLPLVSVIVVNFNYGRFLGAAVDSIFRQSYPNIECVIVDNASTDESAEVLRAIETRYGHAQYGATTGSEKVKVIRRSSNDGQTPAALEGLAASSGPYVIFLDADDLLLPHCVEIHIFVHLSLRIHVGFTSGDMLQVVDDQVVLGTENGFNRVMQTNKGVKPEGVRPYRHSFEEPWPPENFDRSILEKIRFVAARTNEWVWSPTSANCFRRDALYLFSDNPALSSLRTGTDLYFCLGINAVSGSVLIDEAIAVYRIHGGNMFSKRAQLDNVLCYEPGCAGDSNAQAKAILVDHLFDRAEFFVQRGWTAFDYAWLLWRLDCSDPAAGAAAPRWSRRSRLASQLARRFKTIAPVLGSRNIRALMFRCGVPWNLIWRAHF